jgi:hypothetical protein
MDNPERQNHKQHKTSILHYPFSNWFCVVCGSVSLDCPFFITPSLTGFVLFVVLSLWIVHSSLPLNEEWTIQRDRTTNNTKSVREGVMKNRQSRGLWFCLSGLSILHYSFSNWFCVVCGSVSLDCLFFITPSLTGFVLFVVHNTKPVREWVIKNGQSRETERQTTQNQLEKG